MEILWFLLIGLVAGWYAGIVMHGSGYGILGGITVGMTGSFFGASLIHLLGITTVGTFGVIVMVVLGVIFLIAALQLLRYA
jgi:uncharacterized membrane protein YeaQ/YmgE (transglycosylase-associated protein family)